MSLLMVKCVEIDPRNPHLVSGEIVLGTRSERVVLDLSWPDLIAFARMPHELEHHDPARKAVIDLLMRRQRGDAATLPADLSDVVRQANERWPLRAPALAELPALAVTAAADAFEISRIERDHPAPGLTTVQLSFRATRIVVILDHRGDPDSAVRFRFVDGVHPWQLTPAEQYALLRALVRAIARKYE